MAQTLPVEIDPRWPASAIATILKLITPRPTGPFQLGPITARLDTTIQHKTRVSVLVLRLGGRETIVPLKDMEKNHRPLVGFLRKEEEKIYGTAMQVRGSHGRDVKDCPGKPRDVPNGGSGSGNIGNGNPGGNGKPENPGNGNGGVGQGQGKDKGKGKDKGTNEFPTDL